MDTQGPRHLRLGDELNGTVVKAIGGRRFAVKTNQAPRGWKVELHTRRPELIQIGNHTTFWVARVTPVKSEILVHDGDFGRLPISAAMSSRYLAAIRGVMGFEPLTADSLADARSMVARIGSQDQADWLTVWRVLGEPAPGDIKRLLAGIDAMRTARKNEPDSLEPIRQEFAAEFADPLNMAIVRLSD